MQINALKNDKLIKLNGKFNEKVNKQVQFFFILYGGLKLPK